ncbi:hypothetical protein MKX08_000107 [Trichoderma sp. CBMAI-0020]|nr:hypothetical protein MKX08_000107 [Trichoderma sp. CBMAI-0020]
MLTNVFDDLSGKQVTLEEKMQHIWDDMCLKPQTPASSVRDRGHREQGEDSDDDYMTVSVVSDQEEPNDLVIDCPLWRDRPEGLVDALLTSANDATNHFGLLDKVLHDLLLCKVPPSVAGELTLLPIVTRAVEALRRLPRSSTRLFNSIHTCSMSHDQEAVVGEYVVSHSPTSSGKHECSPSWESYKVTTLFDTNTMRLALLVAYLDQTTHPSASNVMQGYVNLLSRLLESLSGSCESSNPRTASQKHARRVAQAFLWTAWQRALLLFSYYVFGTRLRHEMNARFMQSLPRPDMAWDPDIDFSALGSPLQSVNAPDSPGCQYVCRYSFELLRSSALSGTQDYRNLLVRFDELFASRKPRCRRRSNGTWEQCNGKSWQSCGRFFGLQIADQSAHDMECPKPCKRLPWDEASYRSVQGPRSVAHASTPKGGPLKYCAASDQTLAVSHVWSHGQGGNPDQGFNACLHDRYSAIARDLGCDSYWIDAACIPSDAELRSAAIKTINPIFRNSKVTLICDQDIMEVDATEPLSIDRLEIIVSVLLLSDWNVRGWTMLEVVRGNKAVHLLCKHNRTVPLRRVLTMLYKSGSIDLCALLIGSPQLMPPGDKLRAPSIETASTLLSRRYASRLGDDVIIWSLLCGDDKPHQSPISLWKSREHSWVKTGFLMSSCDRIAGAPRGYGWAPATPQVLGPYMSPRSPQSPIFWPYDGSGTSAARITPSPDGKTTFLRGKWLVHVYLPSSKPSAESTVDLAGSCWERAEQLLSLEGYERVLFLRPLLVESVESGWAPDLSAPFTAAQNVEEAENVVVAVCATREDHAQYVDPAYPEEYTDMYELEPECWEWKGVYRCLPEEATGQLNYKSRQVRII